MIPPKQRIPGERHGCKGIMLAVIFVWAGMLLGISFLEAPLKFQAPNVTLAIGLGIGRLVFGTLNKIEIVFAVSIAILCVFTKPSIGLQILLSIIGIILIVQSIWLLPILDARAQIIIAGGIPAESSPHFSYVIGEATKLILLILSGYRLFKTSFNFGY